MADDPTFKIPREVIEPIIQAKVSAAIVEALGNTQWLVSNCIEKVLNEKVKDDGTRQTDSYYMDKSPTFLQWSMRSCVQASFKRILQEEIEKHRPVIYEQLLKTLKAKDSPLLNQLVGAMTDAILTASKNPYQMEVTITEKERY